MTSTSLLKKSALAAAGALPLIAAVTTEPAAAAERHSLHYDAMYPNCTHFVFGYDDTPGHPPSATTQAVCPYSGLQLLKVQFKYQDGAIGVAGPEFVRVGTIQIMTLHEGIDILRTCHQAGADGYSWGPVIEGKDNGGWDFHDGNCSF